MKAINHRIYILTFLLCSIFPAYASVTSIDTVPSTTNFGLVSDRWDGMDYADPTTAIPFIDLPNGISTGNASLSFPLHLPEGRLAMEPSLTVDYDSEGGQTWLGTGWDISLSSISVDTRWGVPRFSSTMESEIYLLDGEQMGPVFHRQVEYQREAERVFHLRQNQSFQKIIRHGNSPATYWWEVTDKDGTRHCYGGTPKHSVSADHVLRSDKGIVQWYLVESREPNGNFISYQYQHIDGQKGKEVYPKFISYTGHDDVEGSYKIDFQLGSTVRADVSLSGRYGFLRSQEHLLERIDISYREQLIRAYGFSYDDGAFGKTLLMGIKAYDSEDSFFYEYGFDYYNDLLDNNTLIPYSTATAWNVTKDNLDIGSIAGNVDGFNGKPTILGSANSESQGGNVSVTVGFVAPPNTKDYTVGPNGGVVNNDSQGITALVDIDGDGLPDKLWREASAIYYRSNMFRKTGQPSFGEKRRLEGISSFSASNTFAWNVGAELNVPPVYAGYTHEESTTRTGSYLIDFNGDELMDIVQNGEVYFNHLENGIPTFTLFPSDTPSPIYLGEGLDPSIQSFDVSQIQELQNQSPLQDVVRVWIAPRPGLIRIDAPVRLIENTSPEASNYLTADGARVAIQVGNIEYYSETIEAGDYELKTPSIAPILVQKGTEVYFRVGSIDDGSYDRVAWNPTISYDADPFPTDHPDAHNQNLYNASEDFLLSEKRSLTLVADGEIHVVYDIVKTALSDTIRLGYKGIESNSWMIAPEKILDTSFIVDTFSVSSGDILNFYVESASNVDWSSLAWAPRVEYISFTDGSSPINSMGNPVISECPAISMDGYFHAEAWEEVAAVDSGEVQLFIRTDFSFASPTNKKVVVKHKNHPELIEYFDMQGIILDVPIQTAANDSIWVGIYYDDPQNNLLLTVDSARVDLNGESQEITCGIYERGARKQGLYGSLYRGWGQFIYDGNDGRSENPIEFTSLEIDTVEAAQDTSVVNENSGSNDLEGTGGSKELLTVMTSDPKLLAWRGSDASAVISRDEQSSSRRSIKYIGPPLAEMADQFSAPTLITRFVSNGGFGGLGVPGTPVSGSAGFTSGTTWSELDLADFNGDRYPDILGESKIQYTNMRGGLSKDIYSYNWALHEAYSEAFSVGLGLNPGSTSAKNSGESIGVGSNKSTTRVRQRARGNAGKARSSFESTTETVGISGSAAFDEDRTVHTFIDLNGDALEDKVWENGDVAINLGYEFAPKTSWGFSGIRAGDAQDFGGGLGINISNGSYLAGISIAKTINASKKGFADLNGDALLDLIVSVDPLIVRFNTGSAFGAPIEWMDINAFDEGQAIGESVNVGFSVPIIFFFIKVVINVQGFVGQGSATSYDAFLDINGDGFPDYLQAEDDDANLTARYSRIGRTNLLHKIHYPLSGELTLDYETVGNSDNMPYSKWVLSSAVMNDGVAGDGSDFQQRTYRYENGFHHRHERQFLGFQHVIQSDMSGNKAVRTLDQEFYIDNYYQKGLLKRAELYDDQGRLHKLIAQQYVLRDVESDAVLPPAFSSRDDIIAFPMLTTKSIRNTEGTEDLFTQQNFSFVYDLYGNVVEEVETDQSTFYKRTDIVYDYRPDSYIVNQALLETISNTSDILRQVDYVLDEKGNRTLMKHAISSTESATTEMSYDEYGLIMEIRRPINSEGERLIYTFGYDDVDHQFQTSEQNNYGYSKAFDYEPLHGTITKFVDENMLEWSYSVDARGRPHSVTNPRSKQMGHEFTYEYSYQHDADVAFATCRHKNTDDRPDIITYQFADGMHRLIQSKLPRTVSNSTQTSERLVVSGTSVLDSLGRVVEQYLEIDEAVANGPLLNTGSSDISPTYFSYDLNDRLTRESYVDGAVYEYQYDVTNYDGASYLRKNVINPLGLQTEMIYNQRGFLRAQRERDSNESYLTVYHFDVANQLREVIHPNQSVSSYEYDLLGRRISILTPESGETSLVYDPAGNLTEKITANIRQNLSQNAAIRYTYDKERLVSIDYPKNFQNKVQISYGEAETPYNLAGRIRLIQDATGGREFFYDDFGNPEKVIQTVLINRSKIHTYVSAYEHDHLNRISTLTYPDGEQLRYIYNNTGQLESLKGFKGDDEYVYVEDIHYDFYGDQVRIFYGNGTINEKRYDNKRRLWEQQIRSTSSTLMDINYEYDMMNNLLLEKNSSPSNSRIGSYSIDKDYDAYSRVRDAVGSWNLSNSTSEFAASFDYVSRNNLEVKIQNHQVGGVQKDLTTRFLDYKYEHADLPLRPSEVAGKTYQYDANGNLSLVTSQAVFDFDQYIYDEENRLIGSSNNGQIDAYSYDAFSRRVLKSEGGYQGIFINGAPAGWLEHKDNYQVELNPYFTAYEHDYRKHVYVNGERIMSKIGTGIFQSSLASSPGITAGSLDYKARIILLEQQILDYYASQGLPPGPPTLLAYYSQPEYNTIGFGDLSTGNSYSLQPSNWPSIAPPDTTGPPGPPVFYEYEDLDNETVMPGYNFTAGQITKELEQFYYYHDPLRNVNLVTAANGELRQFALYFPGGEKWIDDAHSSDVSEFAFQSLRYEKHSGLYNLGEHYYDPITHLNLSLDKYEQTFGSRTLESFGDGNLFYDFAQIDESIEFDPEIINSERPSQIYSGASKVIDESKGGDSQDEDESEIKRNRRKLQVHPDITPDRVEMIADLLQALEVADLQDPQGFDISQKDAYGKIRQQAKQNRARKNMLTKRKNSNKRKVRFRVK